MHLRRNAIVGLLSILGTSILVPIFKETGWSIFVEGLLEQIAHAAGTEKAAMSTPTTITSRHLGGASIRTVGAGRFVARANRWASR
jgi:hypothetical protein